MTQTEVTTGTETETTETTEQQQQQPLQKKRRRGHLTTFVDAVSLAAQKF